jgi:hypothetical protein
MMGFGTAIGLLFSPLAWIVRDRLGPRAIETTGAAAARAFFRTFFGLYVGWPVVGLLLLGSCLLVASLKKNNLSIEE